jgi:hypothetical protein
MIVDLEKEQADLKKTKIRSQLSVDADEFNVCLAIGQTNRVAG